MSFSSKNKVGKKGENLFEKWANRNFESVWRVSENSLYYDEDIDFFCYDKQGKEISYDIKTDTYLGNVNKPVWGGSISNNFFIETISNVDTKAIGCFCKTNADKWCIVALATKTGYIFNIADMRKYINRYHENLPTKTVKDYDEEGNYLKTGYGYLVDKDDFARQFPLQTIHF